MVVMVFEKYQTHQTRYYFGTYKFQKHIWLLKQVLEFQDIKFPKFAKLIITMEWILPSNCSIVSL